MPPEETIITIKRARKLLGSEGKGMSDAQIHEILQTLQELAKQNLRLASSKR